MGHATEQKQLLEDKTTQFKAARANYFKAEKQLSLCLKQKERVKWAAEGDENSRFFQGVFKGRM